MQRVGVLTNISFAIGSDPFTAAVGIHTKGHGFWSKSSGERGHAWLESCDTRRAISRISQRLHQLVSTGRFPSRSPEEEDQTGSAWQWASPRHIPRRQCRADRRPRPIRPERATCGRICLPGTPAKSLSRRARRPGLCGAVSEGNAGV